MCLQQWSNIIRLVNSQEFDQKISPEEVWKKNSNGLNIPVLKLIGMCCKG